MKPIYIEMQAFGSYLDEKINFSKVDHGLFLITGDTGAGKTTIFDAITFALYGKTSGGRREGRMMRSQYAEKSLLTQVKFQFKYAGDVYTITRTPHQPKYKLDKKTNAYVELKTPHLPTVELVLPDGTVYPGKKEETDGKIEEIIGLSAEQFTQVAMLAQGDFMKLLLASSEDRKEIFARIFDTRIYGKIEWLLKRKLDAAEEKLDENKREISRELGRVECAEGSVYREAWQEEARYGFFRESGSEALLNTVKGILEEAKDRRRENEEAKQKNQKQVDAVQKSLHAAESVNQLFAELESRRAELVKLEHQAEEISRMQDRAALAQKAQAVELPYQQYLSSEKEKQSCKERRFALAVEIEQEKALLDRLKTEAERAQASYEEKYPSLQREMESIEASLNKYEAFAQAVLRQKENEGYMQRLGRQMEALEHQMQERGKELERLTQEIDRLRGSGQNIDLLAVKQEQLQSRKDDIAGIQKSIQSLSVQNAEWREQESLCLAASESVKRAQETYERCYHEFISNQAEILRAELKPGEPCPVCGSVRHGISGEKTEEYLPVRKTDRAAVDRAKKELEAAEREKEQAETAKRKTEGNRAVLLATIDGACRRILAGYTSYQAETQGRVAEALRETEESLKQCGRQKMKAEAEKKLLEADEKSRAQYEQAQKAAAEEREHRKEELQECRIKEKEYETDIRTLKEHLKYKTKKEAQRALDGIKRSAYVLKEQNEQCGRQYNEEKEKADRKTGELQQLTQRLENVQEAYEQGKRAYEEALKGQNFADTEAFLAARMDNSQIGKYQTAVNEYRTSVSVAQEAIRILMEQTKEKQKTDTTALEKEQTSLLREREKIEQRGKELFHIVSVNQTAYQRGEALYGKREQLREVQIMYKNLSDTANGNLSGKHLNFQTYIQRRFFKQVIAKANQRLYTMSRGQFLLQCREMKDLEGKGKSKKGLDLDVYSLINEQTRDVKTLSGGESFMAALAMALGMADMIQNSNGSVHIDTMFIDEGFGSLSEETRSEAITMLNDLAQGKRLVGIISHVTELKAQVETKLTVKKGVKGSETEWELG